MRLQGALRLGRAVALVLEVARDPLVVDVARHRRGLGLLHVDDDVVLQGLGVALEQHVVRRQAGRADADALAQHDVLDRVLRRGEPCRGQRGQVLLERGLDLLPGSSSSTR